MNASKIKYVVIRRFVKKLNIFIANTKMCRIGNNCGDISENVLDIFFDENLTSEQHLSHINKKMSRALFSIKQAKHLLPKENLRNLYNNDRNIIHSSILIYHTESRFEITPLNLHHVKSLY